MKRVLLTGGTGLIGGKFINSLAGTAEIYAIGRRQPMVNCHWLNQDLGREIDTTILPDQIDTIVYLAQSEHFREFPERATDVFEINVANVHRLLHWGYRAGVRRFILASSGGVYGHGDVAFREDDAILSDGSLGFYLASKQCAEALAKSYSQKLIIVIVRFFFVYGPGQRSSMLIPRLVTAVKSGQSIQLHGVDGIRINPVYVDDAAAALLRCLTLEESQNINIAGHEIFTLRELVEIISAQVEVEPVFKVQHEVEPRNLVGDINKMSCLLGPPLTSFDVGVQHLIKALP